MKKLQNHFTTPEQSKRLLEWGLPKDSADVPMIVFKDGTYIYKGILKDKTLSDYQAEDDAFQDEQDYPNYVHYYPCWSVGRLIDILKICVTDKKELHEIFEELEMCIDETKTLVQTFKEYSDVIDFSKLEE